MSSKENTFFKLQNMFFFILTPPTFKPHNFFKFILNDLKIYRKVT
jgi:hypothetical protein